SSPINITTTRLQPGVSFGPGVEVNNNDDVVALRTVNASGLNPRQQFLEVWDGATGTVVNEVANGNLGQPGTRQSPAYQTVNGFPTINNSGQVAYSAF